MTPEAKMKILKPYCASARSYHILEFQLSTPENVDVVQMTNFAKKKRNLVF